MKKSKTTISILLLLGFFFNLYGMASISHEVVHFLQSSVGVSHSHIHEDGKVHSHQHIHHSEYQSENHEHNVSENETLIIVNGKIQNKYQKAFHWMSQLVFYQYDSLLLSDPGILIERNNTSGYSLLEVSYVLPDKIAPPQFI